MSQKKLADREKGKTTNDERIWIGNSGFSPKDMKQALAALNIKTDSDKLGNEEGRSVTHWMAQNKKP